MDEKGGESTRVEVTGAQKDSQRYRNRYGVVGEKLYS